MTSTPSLRSGGHAGPDRFPDEWRAANHRYLFAALGLVRCDLERHARSVQGEDASGGDDRALRAALDAAASAMQGMPAIERLSRSFGLTTFERDLILLCAGRDIDISFEYFFAAAQGNQNATYPTLRLALDLWPGGSRDAMTPGSRLVRWGIIEIDPGPSPATRPLRISERVLNYLDGVQSLDESLQGVLRPIRSRSAGVLLESHAVMAALMAETIVRGIDRGEDLMIQLCGAEHAAKHAIAAAAFAALGQQVYVLNAHDAPAAPAEQERFARLWEQEVILSDSALLVDCQGSESGDALRSALSLAERINDSIVVIAADPVRTGRTTLRLDVDKPAAMEQVALWHEALGDCAAKLDGQIHSVVAQFNLGVGEIASIASLVRGRLAADPSGTFDTILWDTCRTHARPKLDDLARRIDPVASWDDLVLPELQLRTIREIAAHLRQRMKVYQEWGFASRSNRGLGISALFAGPSGTGKTMAAEVIAAELKLDLYHVDLSQVTSKYIGETEKNLRRIFDAAEEGGAVLLFDEADALFGKRSEVKDSHDRHANIEVSYLLQRMESYRGLAILTTNMKQSLDTAFLRRIRFVVDFPFPGPEQRGEIWRRIYPAAVPREGLDYQKLAGLNVAGGNIRNIALNAAFLAADEGAVVQMRHIFHAVRTEYQKLERQMTDDEIKEWL